MGSTSSTKTLLADINEYDPATNKWTALAPLPDSREAPVVGIVGTTLVAVDGGGGLPIRAGDVARHPWGGPRSHRMGCCGNLAW